MNKKYFLSLVIFGCSFVGLDAWNPQHLTQVLTSRPEQVLENLDLSRKWFGYNGKNMIKSLSNRIFADCNFTGAKFYNLNCSNSVFTDCNLTKVVLDLINCSESVFIRCDFTKAILKLSDLRDVRFIDCKITGLLFCECSGLVKTDFFPCYYESDAPPKVFFNYSTQTLAEFLQIF